MALCAPQIGNAQQPIGSGGTSLDAIVRSIGIPPHETPSATSSAPAVATVALPPSAEGEERSGRLYKCNPGPWGDLEYYYIYLQAPASLVARFPMPNTISKWSFPGWSTEQIRDLFDKAELPKSFQEKMLDPNKLVNEENVISVFPPLADLEAMTAAQRTVVYEKLAQYDDNEFYKDPVLLTSNDFDDWLRGANIRPGLAAKIQKYLYKRNDVLMLSDLAALLNYMQSDQEARDFQQLMTRTRAVMVRLKLHGETDFKSLSDYWGDHGRRNQDIQPLLQASANTEGVAWIDVTHLLPSLVRRNLYSYPTVDMALLGRIPDCHWSSLNFFNTHPKDYYLNTRLAADQVLEGYEKVSEPYQFGDVLMFIDSNGSAIHSCTYVADNIVYTKNGESLVTPWTLMKLKEVKRQYFFGMSGMVQGFRLKGSLTPNG